MESLSVILPWHPDYQCKAKSTPEAEDVGVLVETMIRNLYLVGNFPRNNLKLEIFQPDCAALYLNSAFSKFCIKADIARDVILKKK